MGARAAVVGLGLAMIGVLAIQTSSTVRQGIDIPRRSMDGATASVARFSSGVAGWSIGFGRDKESAARIAELEAEVRDLMRWKDLSETMAIRMERYERLLDLVGETQGQAVMARVVVESDGPFEASLIANAGAANGVREGFAAINERGLVGRVQRVGEYTSRILLVTDFDSRIPVMGSVSQDRALLVGDRAFGARLLEPETPEKIVAGEMWVTSGDDGQTAQGIPVGRARLVEGAWRVDLALTQGVIDFIRLSPPPDFAKPELAPTLGEAASPNTDRSLVSSAPPPTTTSPPRATPAPAAAPTPGRATGGQGGER
ncbi:MAG: rod shape-determining protein MreC [Alphaproteobacteria bacterium]|nr:rod shape-determining protein MreC [Alphaproteobacteria bacterium]